MKLVSATLRLALTCAFFLLSFTQLAYAGTVCSIDDQDAVTQPLSDLARNIQSLNQQLGAQVKAPGAFAGAAPMALPVRSLLTTRRNMVVQLIHQTPSEVRAAMLGPEATAALIAADPTASSLIERETTVEGELAVSIVDDFANGTSHTLYRLHTMTEDVALFPVSDSNLKRQLHQHLSASGIVLGGAMALETTSTASLSMTGEMASPLPAVTSAADSAPACSTKGDQRVGLIIVKFTGGASYPAGLDQAAYWQSALFGANPSVNNYWKEVSYNQTSLSGDVLGTITLPGNYGCSDYEALRIAALSSARTAFDLSKYNRIMITFPESACTFGGLGYIGCSSADSYVSHAYSFTWIPVMTSYRTSNPLIWGNLAHELGHNLGLGHASTAEYRSKLDNRNSLLGPVDTESIVGGTVDGSGATSASTFIRGYVSEYADKYSVMGNGWTAAGPYSAQHRSNLLGWVPSSNARHVDNDDTFTLAPAESSSGLRSARILRDPASSSWIWLEYHQPTGYYTGTNISQFFGTDLASGIQVYYENGYNGDRLHTYLIDTSVPDYPLMSGSTIISSDFLQHTLTGGQSFVDPFSQIKITAGTPTAAGIPVTVSYEPACASATVTPEVLSSSGGTGQINITAAPSCTYKYSANAPWISIAGADASNSASSSGTRTVTFTYTANTSRMRRNYINVGRVSIPITQASVGGVSILPISPVSTRSAFGSVKNFTVTWENARGLTDNKQLDLYMSPFGTGQLCYIAAVFTSNGTKANVGVYNGGTGLFSSLMPVGTPGSIASPGCNLNTGASSFTTSGNKASLTLAITPTVDFVGGHAIEVDVTSNTSGESDLNDGSWLVTNDASGKQTPTLTLEPSTTSAFAGNTVTLTANISSASGTATGDVTFYDGAAALGTVAINAGKAIFSISSFTAGVHTLTARYSGDANFNTAVSSTTNLTISDFAFSLPNNTMTVNAGAVTGNTLTINLTPVTGSANISIVLSCSGAPAGASCSVNPSPLALNASPATATITVTTTARPASSGTTTLGMLVLPLFGVPAIAYRRRLGRTVYGLAILAGLSAGLGFFGCSNGGSGGGGSTTPPATGTPAGISTLTITATASSGGQSMTRIGTVTLTVR